MALDQLVWEYGSSLTVTHNMGRKTTVEIREPLFDAAQEMVASEGTTLRSLIEEGLELALAKRTKLKPFRLRRASFKGKGMSEGVHEGDWSSIRSLIYEGRGE